MRRAKNLLNRVQTVLAKFTGSALNRADPQSRTNWARPCDLKIQRLTFRGAALVRRFLRLVKYNARSWRHHSRCRLGIRALADQVNRHAVRHIRCARFDCKAAIAGNAQSQAALR